MMKKLLSATLAILLICIFPISATTAESPALKPPVLECRVLSHDRVQLRWTEIENADKYYVYRLDPTTGKFSIRYNVGDRTTGTIGGLEAETEYSYYVEAIGENIAEKSNTVTLKTPAKWGFGYSSKTIADNEDSIYLKIENTLYVYQRNTNGEAENRIIVSTSDYNRYPKLVDDNWLYYVQFVFPELPEDEIGIEISEGFEDALSRIKIDGSVTEHFGNIGWGLDYMVKYGDLIFLCYNEHHPMGPFEGFRISFLSEEKAEVEEIYSSENGSTQLFGFFDGKLYFGIFPEGDPILQRSFTLHSINLDGNEPVKVSNKEFSYSYYNRYFNTPFNKDAILSIKGDLIYYAHIEQKARDNNNLYTVYCYNSKTGEDKKLFGITGGYAESFENNGYFYITVYNYTADDNAVGTKTYYRANLDGTGLAEMDGLWLR